MGNPTPNQPLDQHPQLPGPKALVLGSDANFFPVGSFVEAAVGDNLFIPGPPKGVVRRAGGGGLAPNAGWIVLPSGADLDPGITFILKKKSGAEIVLQGPSTLGASPDTALFTGPSLVFFLTDEDEGVFVRIDTSVTGAIAVVSGFSFWTDCRDVDVDTVLMPTAATRVTILDNPVEDNIIKTLASIETSTATGCIFGFNPDSAAHDVSLFLLDEAGNELPLFDSGSLAVTLPAGGVGIPLALGVALQPGWRIEASMTVAVAAEAPTIQVLSNKTNYGPVRPDQGGAY